MPHEQPPPRHAPALQGEVTHLPVHLAEGGLGHSRIVIDTGVPLPDRWRRRT